MRLACHLHQCPARGTPAPLSTDFIAGLLAFDRLLTDKRCCIRGSFQSINWDGLAGDFTDSVGSVFDTLERPLHLRQFLPIPSIFIDIGFSLVKEACLILSVADSRLFHDRLLNALVVSSDTRLDGVPLRLESLLESTDILRTQHLRPP